MKGTMERRQNGKAVGRKKGEKELKVGRKEGRKK
jgi:hypothetical protein